MNRAVFDEVLLGLTGNGMNDGEYVDQEEPEDPPEEPEDPPPPDIEPEPEPEPEQPRRRWRRVLRWFISIWRR